MLPLSSHRRRVAYSLLCYRSLSSSSLLVAASSWTSLLCGRRYSAVARGQVCHSSPCLSFVAALLLSSPHCSSLVVVFVTCCSVVVVVVVVVARRSLGDVVVALFLASCQVRHSSQHCCSPGLFVCHSLSCSSLVAALLLSSSLCSSLVVCSSVVAGLLLSLSLVILFVARVVVVFVARRLSVAIVVVIVVVSDNVQTSNVCRGW